ncbi:phosphotransferase family protein [Paucibacter sp. DJ2R-2]|uniref:phosphotransferase family protein n=1 Tax=Paucibacter sp. DJ2R-2 TaxID=2893558 RepID=UPI0021E45F88|nr:phosphotransferase [Paucibacter sp. DJ2R-2]MCV2420237.1 phosphotransferase [Paucibacter sp. DJ4R-1]MCV2436818.1 phosphotransferase [Paucibacter sp. DJ2R-2]
MTEQAFDTAPPGLTDAAAAIAGELTGSRVLKSERVLAGMMTFKCRVMTAGGHDVMVRFYPPGRTSLVHQEPDLLRLCSDLGMPVPRPIGDSRTGPPAPLAYVAYPRIAGVTLAQRLPHLDERQRRLLAEDLARHLAGLQQLGFSGAGELISATEALDEEWGVFVDRCMHQGLDAVREHSLLSPQLIGALESVVLPGAPEPAVVTGRLVWGDINFENVLVADNATVAALIDFEGCLSGDPLATLGYCQAVHGPSPFFRLLLDASPGAEPGRQRAGIAWYAVLRAMRLARYAHLALPTGRPRDPLIRILPGLEEAVSILQAARP